MSAEDLPTRGDLELIAEHPLATTSVRDPLGTWVALREDEEVLRVVEVETGELGAAFGAREGALDVEGRRLVTRTEEGLAILLRGGERIEARTAARRGRAWDEAYGFSGDGRYVWLASKNQEGRASIFLYDDRLELLDAVEDLRALGGRGWADEGPLETWGDGCWCEVQPHAPGWLLAVCNAGDSFLAAFAFCIEGGRIRVEHEHLQRAILELDHYFLRALQVTAQGELLVMDRDSLLSVLPWPPQAGVRPRVACSPTARLRDEDRRVALFFEDRAYFDDLEVIGHVSTTRDHVLVGIEHGEVTVALVELDLVTLDARGLIKVPEKNEAELRHLGRDRFYARTERGTAFFRLRQSAATPLRG